MDATTNGKHAVIYDRGSTKKQEGNWSRDDALRIGKELAERNGYTWELRQEIKSGETLEGRPVMLDILKDIEAGSIHAIICQDFTRISRDEDGIDGRTIRRVCRDSNCLIITPNKVFDFSQDADHDMSDFELLVGKIHKRQAVQAMIRGLKERARQGYPVSLRAKIGYRRATNGEMLKGKPVYWPEIVPAEAELVRLVFGAVLQTGSPNAATRWLNRNGHHKPVKYHRNGSTGPDREWLRQDVYRLVIDPIYTGWIVWGRKIESRYMAGFEEQRNYHPELRIVDQGTFDRVQELIKSRGRARIPPRGRAFPFTGLVRCECGHGLVGNDVSSSMGYRCRIYICSFCKYSAKHTGPLSVGETPLSGALIPLAARELEKIGESLRPLLDTTARERSAGGLRDRLIEETQAELAEVERQVDNLAQAVASGVLQPDQAKKTSQELAEKKQRLTVKVCELQERVEIEAEFRRAIEQLSGDLEAVLWRMFEDAPGQLGQLLRFMFQPASIVIRKLGKTGRGRRVEIVGHQLSDDFVSITGVSEQPECWL